jgi:hypothetical protein
MKKRKKYMTRNVVNLLIYAAAAHIEIWLSTVPCGSMFLVWHYQGRCFLFHFATDGMAMRDSRPAEHWLSRRFAR